MFTFIPSHRALSPSKLGTQSSCGPQSPEQEQKYVCKEYIHKKRLLLTRVACDDPWAEGEGEESCKLLILTNAFSSKSWVGRPFGQVEGRVSSFVIQVTSRDGICNEGLLASSTSESPIHPGSKIREIRSKKVGRRCKFRWTFSITPSSQHLCFVCPASGKARLYSRILRSWWGGKSSFYWASTTCQALYINYHTDHL